MQAQRGADEVGRELLHLLREDLEVALEEGVVDGVERLASRDLDGEDHVPALEPRVDEGGARHGEPNIPLADKGHNT